MACRIILLMVTMVVCVARRVSLEGKLVSGQYLTADAAQNHAEDVHHDSHADGHGPGHDDDHDHSQDGAHDHGHDAGDESVNDLGHDGSHDHNHDGAHDHGHDDAHGHDHDHGDHSHAHGHDKSHDHGHDGAHNHGHGHGVGHNPLEGKGLENAHSHGYDHSNDNDHDRNHAHGHDDEHGHGHDHGNDPEGHDHGHGHGKLTANSEDMDFDCSAGIDKAQWGWSALKKKKCGWKDPHTGHDHDHSDLERHTTTEVHVHKGFAILVILLSAVAGVLLRLSCPALNSPTIFGFINVFAGGMFVSMGLFHILPETMEHSPHAMQMLIPTGEANNLGIMLFVSLGFLLVLFFERVLFNAHGDEHNHSGKKEQQDEALKQVLNPKNSFIARVVSGESQEQIQRASVATSHHSTHEEKDGVAAVLLMLSLSVHSMFEGVIVGTATTKETIWLLAAIVVAHKWAAAFAITNQLTAKQLAGWTAWILLSIFSLASPIGAAIGWVIEGAAEENPTAKVVECILNSLAVGTLFYIGMTEVVPEEFTGGRHACLKFFVFVAAFGFVLFLTMLHLTYGHAHHDHDH